MSRPLLCLTWHLDERSTVLIEETASIVALVTVEPKLDAMIVSIDDVKVLVGIEMDAPRSIQSFRRDASSVTSSNLVHGTVR